MSLARALPFDPAIDTLIAYGRLRQQDSEWRAQFQQDSALLLPELFRPGVLADLAALLDDNTLAASLVDAQRQHNLLNQLVWELCSGTLLRTLEAVTGLQHLLPDPYFSLGGWWHQLPDSATENMHPLWQLPTVLGVDIGLQGDSHALDVKAGQARLWQASGQSSLRLDETDTAVGIRLLCFGGPQRRPSSAGVTA